MNKKVWIALFLIGAIVSQLFFSGCKVNQKRAEKYYDENVKNFPEENK
ncbi:MAG: hypothetical protein ACTSWJ_02300 [Candidatus Heimdallarchaeaceae archaeon]